MSLKKIVSKILRPSIPIVRIHGMINSEMATLVQNNINAISTITAKAVAVSINSLGGLPLQSQIIVEKLSRFCHKHHLPLLTFAEDVAVSAGYMILCAGDKVYADKTSIVGSIGAVVQRVNLQGFSDWSGIASRLITSDERHLYKYADPFKNPTKQSEQMLDTYAKNIHSKFIDFVEQYRQKQLKVAPEKRRQELYSAKLFDGEVATKLGLVDEVGTLIQILDRDYPECKFNPKLFETWKDKVSWSQRQNL